MAYQRSVETLDFTFAWRTFADKRLAQCLSGSVSAFSSFVPEYLDPFVKANESAQYVNDNEIVAKKATGLNPNIRAVLKSISHTGMELAIKKCRFPIRQVEFLPRFISPEKFSPRAREIQIFLSKLRFSNSKWLCCASCDSWNTTEFILPGWMRNSTHTTSCLKQKRQST